MASQQLVLSQQRVLTLRRVSSASARVVVQRPFTAFNKHINKRQARQILIRAASSEAEVTSSSSEASQEPAAAPVKGEWVPVLRPEDLPKGVRKEVRVNGKNVLMFWYRNQIYAIESRSPAEGAYSEGFLKAKFTQEYCIECPSTGSLFSLKDGSVVSWYPNNPVLRILTPQDLCRNLEIYPVQLTQEAVSIDTSDYAIGAATRGGSDTALERNNVYGLEPRVYVQGTDLADPYSGGEGQETTAAKAATIAVGISAFGALAVAGTAICLYIESYPALIGWWVALLLIGASLTFQQLKKA